MSDLDLTTLRLFIGVCDSRSITRTAEKERIDASAITRRIHKLEIEAGKSLIKRIRNGVEPTPEGLQLCELSRELLRDAARLSETMALFKDSGSGRLSIATTSHAVAGLLPQDLGQFMQLPDAQGLTLAVQELTSSEVVQAVRDGRCAMGIYWDNVETSGLQTLPYYVDQFCCVVCADHPLAQKASVSYAEVTEFRIIGMRTTRQAEAYVSRTGAINGPLARFIAEMPTHEAAIRLSAANLGVFITSMEVAKSYLDCWKVVAIPLTGLFPLHFRMVFADMAALPLSAQRLIKHLSASHPSLRSSMERAPAMAVNGAD